MLLMPASQLLYEAVVNLLIAARANVNVTSANRFSPLMLAAKNDNLAVVNLLIAARANINAADDRAFSPLIFAAQCNWAMEASSGSSIVTPLSTATWRYRACHNGK